jgi:hypothetical protein
MTATFHACASGPPRIAIEPVTLGRSAFHAMNPGVDRMEHGSSELGTSDCPAMKIRRRAVEGRWSMSVMSVVEP